MKFVIRLIGIQTHPTINYIKKEIYGKTFEQVLNAETIYIMKIY